MINRSDYFRKYLNFFWLRPENALLLAIRAEKYRETARFMGSYNMDVSCGDGVFSFIAMGGELSSDSDMFRGIKATRERVGDYDVFDYYNESYYVDVIKKPDYCYSLGTDWKENLVKKAGLLNYYDELVVHDNNKYFDLKSGSVDYIYSNSFYWVEDYINHLKDLIRMLKFGGCLVLEVKTSAIKNFSSKVYAPFMGDKFHSIIDAGRMSTWKGLISLSEYDGLFSDLNVDIISREPVYGGSIMKAWDIGLRPLFKPLSKMVNYLDENSRNKVKSDWCETFYDLFDEYVSNYSCNSDPDDVVEWIYVLRKK